MDHRSTIGLEDTAGRLRVIPRYNLATMQLHVEGLLFIES